MHLSALRRAFRARPGTTGCFEFGGFLEGLGTSESAWRRLVSVLESDVIPIVQRHHPATDLDEISSTCLTGAFESWVSEWLDLVQGVARVRRLLLEGRHDEAFAELAAHPRFHGDRAGRARALWNSRRQKCAVSLVEGTRSARSHFIARTRARIHEAERKLRRQSHLMASHCSDEHGVPEESACGVEFDCAVRSRNPWRISVLPPAHLPSQDLADRLRRILGAIDELGPEHARVFQHLLDGLSQRSIARIERRDPSVISRRVRNLRELCRMQLLD